MFLRICLSLEDGIYVSNSRLKQKTNAGSDIVLLDLSSQCISVLEESIPANACPQTVEISAR